MPTPRRHPARPARRLRGGRRWQATGVLLLGLTAAASAQEATDADRADRADRAGEAGGEGAPGGDLVLDLAEPLPLQTLLDFVAAESGWNVLYDPELLGGSFTLNATGPIPRSALPGLLDVALREAGLALIDGDPAGFKRVVPASDTARSLGPGGDDANRLEARSFEVAAVDPQVFADGVRPLLTAPENLVLTSMERGMILVVDRPSVLERVQRLVEALQPAGRNEAGAAEVVRLEHAVAADVADAVREAASARLRSAGRFQEADHVSVTGDPRTNQVVIVVPGDTLEATLELARQLDRPVVAGAEPVRRHKLTNTTARDLLRTLKSVAGQASAFENLYADDAAYGRPGFGDGGRGFLDEDGFDDEPGFGRDDRGFGEGFGGGGDRFGPPGRYRGGGAVSDDDYGYGLDEDPGIGGLGGPGGLGGDVLESGVGTGAKVRLAADTNTNSIIVIADPATQEVYAELIRQLDERRPQVQIEATLVSLNTSNNYSLGVQFGTNNASGGGQLVTFSSFGIAGVAPLTGALNPAVGAGLTASLLDADFADVVIRAFEQDGNARVLSAPTLLVNDNEKGQLRSITEQPTVTTSQGEVTTQISFNEYVDAGTSILVTPHISEGGYLQLEYRVEVNSFLQQSAAFAAAGIPPPRQTDKVESMVTIPDGTTIVVGGLTRRDQTETVQKVPLLGSIPVLGALFRQTVTSESESTLFVFLRPTILGSEDFADLRRISEPRLRAAGLEGNEPVDHPDLLRD